MLHHIVLAVAESFKVLVFYTAASNAVTGMTNDGVVQVVGALDVVTLEESVSSPPETPQLKILWEDVFKAAAMARGKTHVSRHHRNAVDAKKRSEEDGRKESEES